MGKVIVPEKVSALKAIRKKCLDCCGGYTKEVELCDITDCTLHPYRFGINPSTYVRNQKKKGGENKCSRKKIGGNTGQSQEGKRKRSGN